jgi:hypothetical protein
VADQISASVGKYAHGAKECYNVPKDQSTVIRLLNQISRSEGGRKESPLANNPRWGVCAPGLYQAILDFQAHNTGLSVDGHVDPGGATVGKLNELAARAAASSPGGSISPSTSGPIRDCTLASSSTYSSWPKPLLETLCRSYKAHSKGTYGGTLPASFEFLREIEPANFEGALDKTHAGFIKVVYDRAARHPGLWSYVDLIYEVWRTDNNGFKFSCKDPSAKHALIDFLNSSTSFCRDTPVMQYYHQGEQGLGSRLIVPTHQCWREVVSGFPGLHICVASAGNHGNEMHVDPNQIVTGKDSDGTCNYDVASMLKHGWNIRKLIFGKK